MTIIKDGNISSGVRHFNTVALLSGVSVNNIVTAVGATGSDSSIPTEQAVREAITTVSNAMFRENAQTIDSDYTVVGTVNASTVGPITIVSGVTITIETNGVWVIL